MLVLCGNGGTGKSTIISELTSKLKLHGLSYAIRTLGEPDALSPTNSVSCALDFIKWFSSFDEDIIIIDSLRLFASLRGALGKGGINKNMSNYLTYLEMCSLRAGKSFICTFNPLDDDENVGGYTNIIKSSVTSLMILDDVTTNPNYQKIHKATSNGYPNGSVLFTTRYSKDRSMQTVSSTHAVDLILNTIKTDLKFYEENKKNIKVSIKSIVTTLLFDITPDKFNAAMEYVKESDIVDNKSQDTSMEESLMTNFTNIFNSNDDEEDFESFAITEDEQ